MWRIAKQDRWKYAFLTFLFVILPFVNVTSSLDPELLPRTILIALFAFGFFLLNNSISFSISSTQKKLIFCALAIMIVSGLSMLHSINFGDALAEWLRLFTVYSVLLIGIIVFSKNEITPLQLVRFVSISLILYHFFALVQSVEIIKPFLKEQRINIFANITSTLANKNFFSEVLVLLFPSTLYGLLYDSVKYKVLHFIACSISFIFILVLFSLACWFAFSVASIIILIIYLWSAFFKGRKKRNIFAGILIIITAGGLIFAFSKSPASKLIVAKSTMVKEYIKHPEYINQNLNKNNNSIFDRILLFRNTIKMIGDHFFIGVGLNNWKLIFPSYGLIGTDVINFGLMNFEHPHNDYLLVFAEQGISGIVLLLLFYFLVIRYLIDRYKVASLETRRFLLVILWVVIAFFLISFFSYPRSRIVQPVILMFFISILFTNGNEKTANKFLLKRYNYFIVSFLLFACVVVQSTRLKSEITMRKVMVSRARKDFSRILRQSQEINLFLYPLELNSTPVVWYSAMANFYLGNIPVALELYQKAIAIAPNHLLTLNDLATAYERSGFPDSALVYYNKALAISPFYLEAKFNKAATNFNLGRVDSAYEDFKRNNYSEQNPNWAPTYLKYMEAILRSKIVDSLAKSNDSLLIIRSNWYLNHEYEFSQFIINYKEKNIFSDFFTVK